jgi:hypothetical protein
MSTTQSNRPRVGAKRARPADVGFHAGDRSKDGHAGRRAGGDRRPRVDRGAADRADGEGGSDEDDEALPSAAPGDGIRGFGDAVAKIMARQVVGDVVPVLAKRRTAAVKHAAADAAAGKVERAKHKERRARKRSHLVPAIAHPADRERGLQRLATKGGERAARDGTGRGWGQGGSSVHGGHSPLLLPHHLPHGPPPRGCVRAVVTLFNAILKHQRAAAAAAAAAAGGASEAAAAAPSAAGGAAGGGAEKASFLELLRATATKVAAGGATTKRPAPKTTSGGDSGGGGGGGGGGAARWSVLDDEYLREVEEAEAAEQVATGVASKRGASTAGGGGRAHKSRGAADLFGDSDDE